MYIITLPIIIVTPNKGKENNIDKKSKGNFRKEKKTKLTSEKKNLKVIPRQK